MTTTTIDFFLLGKQINEMLDEGNPHLVFVGTTDKQGVYSVVERQRKQKIVLSDHA